MTPHIIAYTPELQEGIDALLHSIAEEYAERIFPSSYSRPSDIFNLAGRMYWCALAGDIVVGTVGIMQCAGADFVLKSMFVHKDFRGSKAGTARMLLEMAEAQAVLQGGETMWLGTMEQFEAAQRFYEKQGYTRIEAGDMPACCPMNEVDTVFYSKRLK